MKRMLAAFFMVLALSAFAEYRIWEDKKGNVIEAEFEGIVSSDQVLLRKVDGTRIKVPKAGLCSEDWKYLEYAVSPDIRLDVRVRVDKEKTEDSSIDYGDGSEHSLMAYQEKIVATIVIEKNNNFPMPTRQFTVYLYVIGEDLGTKKRALIRTVTHSFTFRDSNKIQFPDACGTASHTIGSKGRSGIKYEGYLAVVEDDKSKVVSIKTSRTAYEKKLDEIHFPRRKKPSE